MEVLAVCEICGADYIKKNGKSKYCSDACKKIGRRNTLKDWRESHPEYQKEWREDNPEYISAWNAAHENYGRDRSRILRNSKKRIVTCEICGQQFETYSKTKVTCSRACSNIKHQNRIPNDQIVGPDINLKELFNRDSGICYLCGKPCDWSARDTEKNAVGKMYPSIDHVVPLSKGGLHAWNNVRLAHVSCNAKKRDRTV